MSNAIRQQFVEQTQVDRYFLLNESQNIYLTKKQGLCASFLVKGYTSKQIAREINLSHRTVEGYFFKMKNRLEESLNRKLTKTQLIQILRQANLD